MTKSALLESGTKKSRLTVMKAKQPFPNLYLQLRVDDGVRKLHR